MIKFFSRKPFPLISEKIKFILKFNKKKLIGYVAYNHRFEPLKKQKILSENKIGKIYSCRLFYGNGTSTLVKIVLGEIRN